MTMVCLYVYVFLKFTLMECHVQLGYFQHNLFDGIVSKIQLCQQTIAYLPLFGHEIDSSPA